MTLPVFISPTIPAVGETVVLDGSEGRHAVAVKRMTVGEQLALIDGTGVRAEAEVEQVSGKSQLVARVRSREVCAPPRPRVTIVQALPKSERSELAVDLMTQAGVDHIIPWQASRCIAKWTGPKAAKGQEKWQAAAIAAAKQSRRTTIPTVAPLAHTNEVLQLIAAAPLALVLHESAVGSMKDLNFDVDELVLIIGPEGGVSPEELESFAHVGAQAFKLGPEVLRTATAGMVALAALGVLTARW